MCVCVCVHAGARARALASNFKAGFHPTFYPCSNITLPDIIVLSTKWVVMIVAFVCMLMGFDTFGHFLRTLNFMQVTAAHVSQISDYYTYLCTELCWLNEDRW
jgi:hypothetical protein